MVTPSPASASDSAISRPMARALELARGVLGTTSPNPAVGAVVVRNDQMVGEGATQTPGGAHAEIEALNAAGEFAQGSTLYVTLEPCSVFGRTPPCTDAIIQSGVSEVVVAFGDPDRRVDGSGFARLREAGIELRTGDGAVEAARHYRAYAHHRRTGRPFVIAKYAASLDGKIASTSGDARWVSGPDARAWSHSLRAQHDAIVLGVGTVLQDDPKLTARRNDDPSGVPQPLRVVLDSGGRTPVSARVLEEQSLAPTVIVCTPAAPDEWQSAVAAAGAQVLELPADSEGRVPLPALLDQLGERGVVSLVLEGGAIVHGAFFDQHLVQRVHAVIAPILIGGAAASAVGGHGATRMTDAVRMRDVSVERLGADLLVSGDPILPVPEVAATVRRATPEDAPALAALVDDSARRAAVLSGILAATETTEGCAAWVAVAGEEVVGGLTARLRDGDEGADTRARLDHLLIAEPWRDHGLADRLLETAEASAAGQDCRWAVAALRPETEAQGWTRGHWAARGYRYYRRVELFPGDAPGLLLIKEIATREQVERRD